MPATTLPVIVVLRFRPGEASALIQLASRCSNLIAPVDRDHDLGQAIARLSAAESEPTAIANILSCVGAHVPAALQQFFVAATVLAQTGTTVVDVARTCRRSSSGVRTLMRTAGVPSPSHQVRWARGVHEKCVDVDLPEWSGTTVCTIRYEDDQEFCTQSGSPCHGEEPANLDLAGVSASSSSGANTRHIAAGYDQRVDCKGFVIQRHYSASMADDARRAVELLTL